MWWSERKVLPLCQRRAWKVLLPCAALFVIRTAVLSAALSGRLYVHKIARVHICMRVCICPALGTKSDRKVVCKKKKKSRNIFSLFVCATVSALGWGVGECESGVGALCFRKAADWKQWVSLEKPGKSAQKKGKRHLVRGTVGVKEGRKMLGLKQTVKERQKRAGDVSQTEMKTSPRLRQLQTLYGRHG